MGHLHVENQRRSRRLAAQLELLVTLVTPFGFKGCRDMWFCPHTMCAFSQADALDVDDCHIEPSKRCEYDSRTSLKHEPFRIQD